MLYLVTLLILLQQKHTWGKHLFSCVASFAEYFVIFYCIATVHT